MGGFLQFFSFAGGGNLPPGAAIVYEGGTVDVSSFDFVPMGGDFVYESRRVYTLTPNDITGIASASNLSLDGTFNLLNLPSLQYFDISGNFLTELDIAGHPSLSGDLLFFSNLLTELDARNMPSLINLAGAHNSITDIQLDNTSPVFNSIDFSYNVISEALDIPEFIVQIISTNNFTNYSLNLLGGAITNIFANSSGLTAVDGLANNAVLSELDFGNTDLDQSAIDKILLDVDNTGALGGILDLRVNGGISPTGGILNLNYISLLNNKGWTVFIN